MSWNQQGQDMTTQPAPDYQSGRIEISDPRAFDLFLSDAAVQQIRQIEESVLTAEERLGTFRVG